MLEVSAVLLGLATTLLIGLGVSCALKVVEFDIPAPEGFATAEKWNRAFNVQGVKGAGLLGCFERILYFASFWTGANIAIAGWLAFKLGSKWQTWQHIIKVPEDLATIDQLEKFHVLTQFGNRIMARFLIGSVYNVLCGLGGVAVGRFCLQLLTR